MNKFDSTLMGNRIKSLRKSMNISQEQLAEKVGMKRTNVSNYESGRVTPPSNVLFELAELFSVSADYLLGRETNDATSLLALRTESLQEALSKIEMIVAEAKSHPKKE